MIIESIVGYIINFIAGYLALTFIIGCCVFIYVIQLPTYQLRELFREQTINYNV